MTNAFSMLQLLHYIINKLKVIQKEYQKLSLLLNSIIGKISIFHHIKKAGKNLN